MARFVLAVGAFALGLCAGWLLFGQRPHAGAPDGRRAERPLPAGAPAANRAADRVDGESAPAAPEPAGGARDRGSGGARRRIVEVYRERTGESPPADMLDAAAAELESTLARLPGQYAARAAEEIRRREALRRDVGEIAEPVALLLQVRVGRSGRIDLVTGATRRFAGGTLSGAPIDMGPVARGDPSLGYVEGGIVPPGKVLFIERVELTARQGSADGGHPGTVELGLPGRNPFRWARGTRSLAIALTGRLRVSPGSEDRLYLAVKTAAAEGRLTGSLVTDDEADGITPAPLVVGEHNGFLTGEPVVLQVVADHGGGNPRTIHLAGGHNIYIDETSSEAVWSDSVDLAKLRRSSAYYRGAGIVPPGKAYRIHRIEYRARLAAGKGRHSDFVVRVGREVIFETDASRETDVAGAWTGSALVRAGEEQRVEITCSYFGMGEAVIFGDLVDAE